MALFAQFFTDLFTDIPPNDLVNKSPQEVKKALRDRRLKRCKVICYCGVTVMMLLDKGVLLGGLYQYSRAATRVAIFYFAFNLVSMLMGITASSFPDTSPGALAVSWNGVLQTVLFLNAAFHLKLLEVYPEVLQLTACYILTSVVFIIYWCFCAQEPKVHLVEAVQHK